ncbi:hypothetical protein K7J14_15460 [Treponema zuelzerae]|uniref:Uncharacterized protein n=1 Tax=Teretinema zuelzerae TaxID=156 RepID=A0AAE3JJ82_9SPIR|nr:hypothetical protein [Teretinema zuelzerae]MCD1656097.1 hypothetical protein [Teretinema zuelzerae]
MTVPLTIYLLLSICIITFQICLLLGVPWGSASMGGRFPGSYPKNKRLIPLISIVILIGLAVIVIIRVGLIFQNFLNLSKILIWIVAAYYGFGIVLNTITPSKIERIWAPVALIQFICILIIALD